MKDIQMSLITLPLTELDFIMRYAQQKNKEVARAGFAYKDKELIEKSAAYHRLAVFASIEITHRMESLLSQVKVNPTDLEGVGG